ncbi:hypothetical protein HMPREF9601_02472 [Cutibacterium acnes HL030PA1]|nr:hypothetical protein HMPREF9601_02472 [Cutibacterium acnes HL030PA1]
MPWIKGFTWKVRFALWVSCYLPMKMGNGVTPAAAGADVKSW